MHGLRARYISPLLRECHALATRMSRAENAQNLCMIGDYYARRRGIRAGFRDARFSRICRAREMRAPKYVVAEWLGCRALNQRVVGANPGEGTTRYL
jgi:hypothetical protein